MDCQDLPKPSGPMQRDENSTKEQDLIPDSLPQPSGFDNPGTAQECPSQEQRQNRKPRKRGSPDLKLRFKLIRAATAFRGRLEQDEELAAAIGRDPAGFRDALIRAVKGRFPLKRGRPVDPNIQRA